MLILAKKAHYPLDKSSNLWYTILLLINVVDFHFRGFPLNFLKREQKIKWESTSPGPAILLVKGSKQSKKRSFQNEQDDRHHHLRPDPRHPGIRR